MLPLTGSKWAQGTIEVGLVVRTENARTGKAETTPLQTLQTTILQTNFKLGIARHLASVHSKFL